VAFAPPQPSALCGRYAAAGVLPPLGSEKHEHWREHRHEHRSLGSIRTKQAKKVDSCLDARAKQADATVFRSGRDGCRDAATLQNIHDSI
jgi:hypothetical protein